jgi:hypothetical protein
MTKNKLSANEYLMEKKTMLSRMNDRKTHLLSGIRIVITSVSIMVFAFCGSVLAESGKKVFATGEEAVNALVKAFGENNKVELLAIFGPDANELISSGDEVADKQKQQKFLDAYNEQHKLSLEADKLIIIVGKDGWPFPIPLVKQSEQWVFDTAAGKEEILNRRIGRNELDSIQVMLAIVDAEREYAMKIGDGNGLLNMLKNS